LVTKETLTHSKLDKKFSDSLLNINKITVNCIFLNALIAPLSTFIS